MITEKTRQLLSESHKGKRFSKETKKRMSKSAKQYLLLHPRVGDKANNWIGGKPLCRVCGKKLSNYCNKICASCAKGQNSWAWKGGITSLRELIRHCFKAREWSKQIFKKDNYACQKCGVYGGDLEAHHTREFIFTFREFPQEYDQFSPYEDKETLVRLAIKYKPFWSLNDGQTLCKKCHKLTKHNRKKEVKNARR